MPRAKERSEKLDASEHDQSSRHHSSPRAPRDAKWLMAERRLGAEADRCNLCLGDCQPHLVCLSNPRFAGRT